MRYKILMYAHLINYVHNIPGRVAALREAQLHKAECLMQEVEFEVEDPRRFEEACERLRAVAYYNAAFLEPSPLDLRTALRWVGHRQDGTLKDGPAKDGKGPLNLIEVWDGPEQKSRWPGIPW